MDDKIIIGLITGGAALLGVGIKAGYDYWREKANDKKLWNDLLHRLIQLHSESLEMKNTLKSHKDINKVQSESLVAELEKLREHFEECLSDIGKIDPVLAANFKVKIIINLLRQLAIGFREEKKTEEEKNTPPRKTNKHLSPIELRKRILGLERKQIKIRKELNEHFDKLINNGLPVSIITIKLLLKITSEKLGGKVKRNIAKVYPYSQDDAKELLRLIDLEEKKGSADNASQIRDRNSLTESKSRQNKQ